MIKGTEELVDKFNKALKKLGRVYMIKSKGGFLEEDAYRTNKRLQFVVTNDPTYILELTGPYYIKYGELIRDRKIKEFLNMDFNDEKQYYRSTSGDNDSSDDDINTHVKFIKDLYVDSSEKEKNTIADLLNDMLVSYCGYVLLLKNT